MRAPAPLRPVTGRAHALVRSVRNGVLLARRYGQFRSMVRVECVDATGEPIPWYTYPASEWLAQHDFSGSSVFEFGSGASSTYWARRAARVLSVENDAGWHQQLARRLLPNQEFFLRTDRDGYVGVLADHPERFDVIVVDGMWRHACVPAALAKRAAGGLIILDNADWFPEIAAALRQAGLLEIDFSGFGPINGYTWTTAIFVDGDTRLQAGYRAPLPLGGVAQLATPEM